MANSPSYDIIQYLVDAGVGLFAGNSLWSLHDGGLPAAPMECIGVATSSGLAPDTDELDIYQPGIQILTCSLDKIAAYAKQEQIRDLLIRPLPVVTPTSSFTQIDLVTDFLDIGKDQINRYVWSANYRTRRVLT